ncbi:unnamed protein product [Absidia cylindrospora]
MNILKLARSIGCGGTQQIRSRWNFLKATKLDQVGEAPPFPTTNTAVTGTVGEINSVNINNHWEPFVCDASPLLGHVQDTEPAMEDASPRMAVGITKFGMGKTQKILPRGTWDDDRTFEFSPYIAASP